jgi:DNA polymerase V
MKIKKQILLEKKFDYQSRIIPSFNKETQDSTKNFSLNLGKFLVPDPEECYLVQVSGESMIDENIHDGDILVVNKSEQPQNGKIVIASLNGEMAVKTFKETEEGVFLISANKKFLPIKIADYIEFKIQGVVKHVIKKM